MNILTKIFGSKTKTASQATMVAEPETLSINNQHENAPPIDLFIDNEAPQFEKNNVEMPQSKISHFLNRNYLAIGINDGFEYHSQETLETGKKRIRVEFQLIIDKMIQEKNEKKLQAKNLIVDVASISQTALQKLQNTIDEVNASIMLLQKQKELSAENEGWVMNTIHGYHQGFIQGINDYIASEELLNSIKYI